MFERALVYKVAAFIQLANFLFVIFLVVERQIPTVIYTRAVAMNWGLSLETCEKHGQQTLSSLQHLRRYREHKFDTFLLSNGH